jgi:hypothetical protein
MAFLFSLERQSAERLTECLQNVVVPRTISDKLEGEEKVKSELPV